MSRIPPPEDLQKIGSLSKQKTAFFDAMAAGPGTPWEDRSNHGTVGAFFKTAFKSMSSPARLVDAIRRPETTNESTAFVIGCSIFWGLSALMHGLIALHFVNQRTDADIDTQLYYEYCAIAFLAAGGGAYLLFRLFNIIYSKLVAQEKNAGKLPAVLLYNVTAYAMGPSILAIIPFVGPPLAALLIFIDLIVVGHKRLNLRLAGAVIDAFISSAVVVVLVVVTYFAGVFLLHNVLGEPVHTIVIPEHVAGR